MISESDLKLKIRETLMGPIVMTVVMIGIGLIILTVVAPGLSRFFEKLEITPPLTTRIMIALSEAFIRTWFRIFLLLAGSVFLIVVVLKTSFGRKFLDRLFLRLPQINQIVRKINTAYTVRQLSFFTAKGTSLAESLETIAGTIGNFYYQNALTAAAQKVKNGSKISEALRPYQNLYSSIFIQMLEVGEDTGQLPRILEKLDYFLNDEVSHDLRNLAIFIELVLMAVFGVLAGLFAVSAVQPLIPFVF